MNEPTEKKEPGFFESLVRLGTHQIRDNVSRRLGRAWEQGRCVGAGLEFEPLARPHPQNPFLDAYGQPKLDENGVPVTVHHD